MHTRDSSYDYNKLTCGELTRLAETLASLDPADDAAIAFGFICDNFDNEHWLYVWPQTATEIAAEKNQPETADNHATKLNFNFEGN